MSVRFGYNRRGGLTVDRDSLHASEGYNRQVEALKQLPERKAVMGEKMTDISSIPATLRRLAEAQPAIQKDWADLIGMADAIDAHLTQPAQAVDVPDRGPWRWMYDGSLRGTGAYTLQSDDFRHDAQIRVSGDFADHDDVAAYMKWLCAKLNGTAALPKDSNEAEGVDSMLLDWLEDQAIRSPTGISLDYCRYVEDGLVLEQGYRFMRRHFLGDRKATLREAIKSAMAVAR